MKSFNKIIFLLLITTFISGCITVKNKDLSTEKQAVKPEETKMECLIRGENGLITKQIINKTEKGCPPLTPECNQIITCKQGAIFPAEELNKEKNICQPIVYPKNGPCYEGINMSNTGNNTSTNLTDNNSNNDSTIEKEDIFFQDANGTCSKYVTCPNGEKIPLQEYDEKTQTCLDLKFANDSPCFNHNLVQ